MRTRLLVLTLLFVVVTAGGCQDVEVRLEPSGLAKDDVILEVTDLGRPDPKLLARRARAGDIDGSSLLGDDACEGRCRALEVTLFITNRSVDPAAPPVVRLSSPPGRPARQPVALRADEISEGRAGRVRFLLSLWPEEEVVVVRPSASVFIEVQGGSARADDAARKP